MRLKGGKKSVEVRCQLDLKAMITRICRYIHGHTDFVTPPRSLAPIPSHPCIDPAPILSNPGTDSVTSPHRFCRSQAPILSHRRTDSVTPDLCSELSISQLAHSLMGVIDYNRYKRVNRNGGGYPSTLREIGCRVQEGPIRGLRETIPEGTACRPEGTSRLDAGDSRVLLRRRSTRSTGSTGENRYVREGSLQEPFGYCSTR